MMEMSPQGLRLMEDSLGADPVFPFDRGFPHSLLKGQTHFRLLFLGGLWF